MPRKRKTKQGTDLAKIIGKNIKAARIRAGLTQSAVAEELEMEPVSISRIETGAQLPGMDRLDELAALLRVPLPAIVSRRDKDDGFLEAVSVALAELPSKDREFICDFIVSYAAKRKVAKKK